jgi:cyclopropane fatty-acyl-phospholipid synthase-like methyltransferase
MLTPGNAEEASRERFYEYDVASTRRFFARFGSSLDVAGKTVLDVGCGRGATAVEAVRRGTSSVVAVDLEIAPQVRELIDCDPQRGSRRSRARPASTASTSTPTSATAGSSG